MLDPAAASPLCVCCCVTNRALSQLRHQCAVVVVVDTSEIQDRTAHPLAPHVGKAGCDTNNVTYMTVHVCRGVLCDVTIATPMVIRICLPAVPIHHLSPKPALPKAPANADACSNFSESAIPLLMNVCAPAILLVTMQPFITWLMMVTGCLLW